MKCSCGYIAAETDVYCLRCKKKLIPPTNSNNEVAAANKDANVNTKPVLLSFKRPINNTLPCVMAAFVCVINLCMYGSHIDLWSKLVDIFPRNDTESAETGISESSEAQVNEIDKRVGRYYENELITYDDYFLPDSDTKEYSYEEIEQFSLKEIQIAKNELYARHGRIFTDDETRSYFEDCDWYEGTVKPDDFDDEVFSDIERHNKDLFVKRENELKESENAK